MTRFFAVLSLFAASLLPAGSATAQVNIQQVTSPGGISAWLVEDHSIPFLALDIRFLGGTTLDDPETRGATALMMSMLEEGAGAFDATEYATRTESLAAYFGFDYYLDITKINASILSQNRDEAVELLRLAINEPRFDEEALERVRLQMISVIESNAQDPGEIAWDTFQGLAFGEHPYGASSEGSVEGVMALTREDLIAAHRAQFSRDHVVVGAAGDITPEELGEILDILLGDLPETGAPLVGTAPYEAEGGITVVDFPSPQTQAYFAHDGIYRDDPDFFPAFILMRALGGSGFQSRLMQEVRVERGLTYGIYASMSLADHRPLLQGSFSSSNDLVAEAVEVLRSEWANVAENAITQEELEAVQRYLVGSYPMRFVGNSNIASIMAAMQSDSMPIDYVLTRNDRINAVTLADIQRVAGRLLQPENLHIVLVGQPEGIEGGE